MSTILETKVTGRASARPWLGILAVLFGAFISTLNARLSAFGLADIRGAIHAGFDEGAWIVTAHTSGQMLVTPLAVWAGGVYGPRRCLIWGATLFCVAETVLPFSSSVGHLIACQLAAGIGSGTFIPLTLPVVLRSTQPRYWAYGIAVYGLNLELSLNISASLEEWYIANVGWQWIFWQNVPLVLAMIFCLINGLPRQPLPAKVRLPAVFGPVSASVGLAMIYAALDQGNRLDWLSSGTVVGLFSAGGILVVASLVHLHFNSSQWFFIGKGLTWPLPLLLFLVVVLRLTLLSTSYLVPQFLVMVRGFRALEVGQALVWIAIPQLVTAPLAAFLLRSVDSRWVAMLGLLAIAVACGVVASGLTAAWGPREFLQTQLLQSFGQSMALSGIVFTAVLHMRPDIQLTFGGLLQTSRLLGGEMGLAVAETLQRVREQRASNLIGQHVIAGSGATIERIGDYAQALNSGGSSARPYALLAAAVRQAAGVQSFIDSFAVIATVAATALAVVIVVGRAPDGPAAHRPFFAPRLRP